jgi:hypothetical protein
MIHSNTAQCPLCGGENRCQRASTGAYKGPCWCESVEFPDGLLDQLNDSERNRRCICANCVDRHPTAAAAPTGRPTPTLPTAPLGPADYYTDTLGRMVFTEQFHLRRGTCCGNDCRHCPYEKNPELSECPSRS